MWIITTRLYRYIQTLSTVSKQSYLIPSMINTHAVLLLFEQGVQLTDDIHTPFRHR